MNILKQVILIICFTTISQTASSQIYPSAGTAWVITGNQQSATAKNWQQQFNTPEKVSRWEENHADISIGGHFQHATKKITKISYMYNQKLEWKMGVKEQYLRHQLAQSQQDYESLFLHFQNDTTMPLPKNTNGHLTPLYGVPEVVAIKNTDSGVAPIKLLTMPLQQAVTLVNQQTLYLLSSEKLDGLTLQFNHQDKNQKLSDSSVNIAYATKAINSADDRIIISNIASNINASGSNPKNEDANWQPLAKSPLSNITYVSWFPPKSWPRVAFSPVLNQQTSVAHARFFVIKITINTPSAGLQLAGINLPSWYSIIQNGDEQQVTISGWDPVNDINKDNYIDDREYAMRNNNQASARFPYQARLVPLGRMWSPQSSFCYTNLFTVDNRKLLAEYLDQHWQAQGFVGAYNDDLYRIPGKVQFPSSNEGKVLELQLPIKQVSPHYWQQLSAFTQQLQQTGSERWIGANISNLNLFTQPDLLPVNNGFNFFVREDYIHPSMGLANKDGLLQRWEHFVLAAQGKRSILMANTRKGGKVSWQGHTASNWSHDKSTNLAIFYLLNNPTLDFYQQWNNSFHYSSANTESGNFYQAGIPKNAAYQPTSMLRHDIGKPMTAPAHYPEVSYVDADNHIIATSRDNQLNVNNQRLSMTPSHWFYLYSKTSLTLPWQNAAPQEAVIARRYQHGLILYYTDRDGKNKTFSQQATATVELPGQYRRLNADGSLGKLTDTMTLTGYQGVILIPEQPAT
ncbi:hypothetical protein [Moritella sp. F3]|uniref:hypothetical protein n=1 Tax=Moritella sp. F3 TaxID=2718882 RepID=UPI0018E0CE25|nr:hypothetical protein [Moritella sp. F3]GIC77344.1 hypothetical protein FMO001_20710 [Moritella sp. F1]GIC83267.1 hypothetical protein FMO003_35470 [Moritella sp. F3]